MSCKCCSAQLCVLLIYEYCMNVICCSIFLGCKDNIAVKKVNTILYFLSLQQFLRHKLDLWVFFST